MRVNNVFVVLAGLGLFGVVSCSTVKEQVGLTRSSPDEFMVVKNAPLSMPPDYSLRPPQPGAPRPQDLAASQAARVTVFGGDDNGEPGNTSYAPSNVEDALLQQAGTTSANPNIRNVVDAESQEVESENKTVASKLLGWGDDRPGATVVNAKEEAERLQKNADEGKPITAGVTPTIEQ